MPRKKQEIEPHVPVVHEAAEDAPFVEPILTTPVPGHIPVLRQLGVALALLLVVFGTTYVGTLVALFEPAENVSDVHVSNRIETEQVPTIPDNPFSNLSVQGRAAFVWDVRNQEVLFNKNADEQLPLASITKLMTALVAYELLSDEDMINVSIEAIKTDGDSGLMDGETFSLKSMTDLVLVASSNDGAAALSAAAGNAVEGSIDPNTLFVHAMNLRAKELGLTNTEFKNATGLDVSTSEAGALGSARDVALLMEYLVTQYPEVTKLTTNPATRVYNEQGEYHLAENTNEVVDDIEGLLASKTGYTELAGGNLVVAFDAGLNRPVIAVVIGSTYYNRFTDILELTNRARAYIASQPE
jgi:serine-type D-Ala-D-Ala carboxypeptidase (penicillin-binding protein 5/6)